MKCILETLNLRKIFFSKNAQGISKNYHEVLFLKKFLQTNPSVKNMNINYHDLYYTVIKKKDKKDNVDDKYENNKNDYINFKDFVPNHYTGVKPRETLLK